MCHWSREHVTSYDDMIYAGCTDVLEYGFERGKISVNVIDSCKPPHGHFLR